MDSHLEESPGLDHLHDIYFLIHLGDSFLDRSLLLGLLATLKSIGQTVNHIVA